MARDQDQGPGTRGQGTRGPEPGIRTRDQGPEVTGPGTRARDKDQGPGVKGPGEQDKGPGTRDQGQGPGDQGSRTRHTVDEHEMVTYRTKGTEGEQVAEPPWSHSHIGNQEHRIKQQTFNNLM